jgi:hypothetical protein
MGTGADPKKGGVKTPHGVIIGVVSVIAAIAFVVAIMTHAIRVTGVASSWNW